MSYIFNYHQKKPKGKPNVKPEWIRACMALAAGETKVDAYLIANPRSSREMAKAHASRFFAKRDVVLIMKSIGDGTIDKLAKKWGCSREKRKEIAEVVEEELLTRVEKRKVLAAIAREEGHEVRDRLAAIKIDNEMTGDNAPVRVDHTATLVQIVQQIQQEEQPVLPTEDEIDVITEAIGDDGRESKDPLVILPDTMEKMFGLKPEDQATGPEESNPDAIGN